MCLSVAISVRKFKLQVTLCTYVHAEKQHCPQIIHNSYKITVEDNNRFLFSLIKKISQISVLNKLLIYIVYYAWPIL